MTLSQTALTVVQAVDRTVAAGQLYPVVVRPRLGPTVDVRETWLRRSSQTSRPPPSSTRYCSVHRRRARRFIVLTPGPRKSPLTSMDLADAAVRNTDVLALHAPPRHCRSSHGNGACIVVACPMSHPPLSRDLIGSTLAILAPGFSVGRSAGTSVDSQGAESDRSPWPARRRRAAGLRGHRAAGRVRRGSRRRGRPSHLRRRRRARGERPASTGRTASTTSCPTSSGCRRPSSPPRPSSSTPRCGPPSRWPSTAAGGSVPAELGESATIDVELAPGALVTQRMIPVGRVGLYVPGGLAPLASSVIMNVVPAQVAGVASIAVASPPQARVRRAAAPEHPGPVPPARRRRGVRGRRRPGDRHVRVRGRGSLPAGGPDHRTRQHLRGRGQAAAQGPGQHRLRGRPDRDRDPGRRRGPARCTWPPT